MAREKKEALIAGIIQRYKLIAPYLSERTRRIWGASEAIVIGRGGISLVCEATGISRVTLTEGKKELQGQCQTEITRTRRKGGGRKQLSEQDPHLLADSLICDLR